MRSSTLSRLFAVVPWLAAGLLFAIAPVGAQPYTVATKIDLVAGAGPSYVATGDLNADGHPDLVSANFNGASVSVFLGNGAGGFGARTDFTAGNAPIWVALGDLNRDGRLDAVVSNYNANTVSVLLGNGSGGFGAKSDFATGVNPYGVALSDVNRDGRPDVVVTNSGSNSVSVLLGDGVGSLGTRTDVGTGVQPDGVAVADLNGDGKPDLAVANAGEATVSVYVGDGVGSFVGKTDYASGTSCISVAVGDLNNDAKADLVTANFNANTFSVRLGDGAGGFGAKTDVASGSNPISVAIGDLNGDNKPDLAAANYFGNNASVLLGNGLGGFGPRKDFATGSNAYGVSIADLNGDGRRDLAVANQGPGTVSILLGATTLGLATRFGLLGGSSPQQVVARDVDLDGRTDLLTANVASSSVSVWHGDGSGGFGNRTDFQTTPNPPATFGVFPVSLATADFNGDGRQDIVTASSGSNDVAFLLGNASGGFTPTFSITTGPQPLFVDVSDFNLDGKMDVAVLHGGPPTVSDTVLVMLGNGTGGFPSNLRTRMPTGHGPRALAIKDVNADGRPDLITANRDAFTVSVLLANPGGGFAPKVDYAVGGEPVSVAVGDLNGDGKPDLAVANRSDWTVSVLLGTGSGAFGPPAAYAVGEYPTGVVLRNGTLPGFPDIAVTNENLVTVLSNDGSGGFRPGGEYLSGLTPNSIISIDLNGDGTGDLATTNGDDSVSVFMGLRDRTRATLASSSNPSVLGSPMALIAQVTMVPAIANPPGTIAFFDGQTLLGSVTTSNGLGAWPLTPSTPGTHSYSAVFTSRATWFGSVSNPVDQLVVPVGNPPPVITGISDVTNDQGRSVRLRFRASGWDVAGAIHHYDLFRRIDPLAAPQRARPSRVQVDGWDFVGTLSAYADSAYVAIVPTLADSNITGIHRATFFVRAATPTPSLYYDSASDSGYSVDNLPPQPPAPFTAAYAGGATHLHWAAGTEPDLWYYKLYRGNSAGFVPGPSNLIATRSDTGYVDPGQAGSYYKLSGVDVNGNEGAVSTLGPNGTTGVPNSEPLAFRLTAPRPNPSSTRHLAIEFSLPSRDPAHLELLDVSGRRVLVRHVDALGAGPHAVDLAEHAALAPGLYMVRLVQGEHTAVARVTLR